VGAGGDCSQRVLWDGGAPLIFAVPHLVPRSMNGQTWMKRLLVTRPTSVPSDLGEGMAGESTLAPVGGTSPITCFKAVYAIGRV